MTTEVTEATETTPTICRTDGPVHLWFGVSYSNYAVLSRTLMQSGWVRVGDTVLWDGQWRELAQVAPVERSEGRRRWLVLSLVFADGLSVETEPYWVAGESDPPWTVRLRRRSAIPEGARR